MLWSRRRWIIIGACCFRKFGDAAPPEQAKDKNADEADEQVYDPADVSSPARPIRTVKPSYTDRARRNAIHGTVALQFVISSDGIPKEIEITKSLDPELDQASIEALKLWRFTPARKSGKPVAVRASIEFAFGVV